jgi:hypothetical protein
MVGTDNHTFIFLSVFTIIIVSIILYVSAISTSKEEFVEVYWQINSMKDLRYTRYVNCKMVNCSLSGIYEIGKVNINGKIFNATLIDIVRPSQYYHLCIDFNNDGIYCDNREGPFTLKDSFLMGKDAFNILYISNNNIVIADYPHEVYDQNFTTGFVMKSHYFDTRFLNISLFVNQTLEKSKTIQIEPEEEVFSHLNVSLPTKGLFRVEVSVSPLGTEEKSSIDFWVEKR